MKTSDSIALHKLNQSMELADFVGMAYAERQNLDRDAEHSRTKRAARPWNRRTAQSNPGETPKQQQGETMTDRQKNVNALIERLERHQEALGLNDSQFVARYQRHLGSLKSWTHRLKARNWAEMGEALDKWHAKLSVFVSELDGASRVVDYYDELPIARYAGQMYSRLQGQTSDRRCAVLIATYGCGKSVAMRHLSASHPGETAYIRANETWKNSRSRIINGIAYAVGASVVHNSGDTFDNVVELLKGSKLTLLIDEGHEGGVMLMKLMKTLIDETSIRIIFGTYPTAWLRLVNGSSEAYAEAQQLISRTVKPIEMRWKDGIGEEDVVAYVKLSTGLFDGVREMSARVLPALKRGGNFRVLADAIETAGIISDENNHKLDASVIETAIAHMCPNFRNGRMQS